MRRYIHIFKISIALVAVTLTVSCNKNSGATESGNELEIIDTKPASEVNATDYSFCILSPSLNGEFAAEVATRFKGGPADLQSADILFIGQEDINSDRTWEAYENGKTIAVASPQIELLNGAFKEKNIPLLPDKTSCSPLAIAAFNKTGDIFTADKVQSSDGYSVAVNSLAKWTTYVRPYSFGEVIDSQSLLQATHIYNCWNVKLTNELVLKSDKFEHRMSGDALFEQFYSVIPLHSFDNSKGDFYLIDATFSVASKDMYQGIKYVKFNKRNNYYVAAFFLKGFTVKVELVDKDGKSVATKFYNVPQPVTMSGNTTYSSGITWSADATLSGGKSGGNLTLSGGVTYNSSKSRTINDVMIASAAQSGIVDYTVDIKNLPSKPVDPPLIARNTLDFHCGWVWYVDSAKDNDDDTYYRIKVTVNKLNYASKGGAEYDGMKNEHLFNKEFQFNLPQPNRIPGGFVKFYNSIPNSYMTNISFIDAKDDSKIYKDESGSVYTHGEFYEVCLPEGEYNLEFYIGDTKHTSSAIGTFNVVRAETLTLQSGVYK